MACVIKCYARLAFGRNAIGPFLLGVWILGPLGMRFGFSVDGPCRSVSLASWFSLGFFKGERLHVCFSSLSATNAHSSNSLGSYSKNLECELPTNKAVGKSPDLAVVHRNPNPLLLPWPAYKFRSLWEVCRFGKALPAPRILDLNLILDSEWQGRSSSILPS